MDDKLRQILSDIKSVKIQGATNVAEAVLDGMLLYAENSVEADPSKLLSKTLEIGKVLSMARENEPLARNAVTFTQKTIGNKEFEKSSDFLKELKLTITEFFDMLAKTKRSILDNGVDRFCDTKCILTHCHSSTAVGIIKGIGLLNKDLEVFATETRPLFQGRLTSKDLVDAGIKTTLVVDSAVTSLLLQQKYGHIDAVFIGCDELSSKGDLINKIGSLGIAYIAKANNVPLYVVTTLLKINRSWDGNIDSKDIELRPQSEVWADAPMSLRIINPAFDIVEASLISGFITEAGILDAASLDGKLSAMYNWA